jgi:hypothetical protein
MDNFDDMWFQQDEATSDMASINLQHKIFPRQIISCFRNGSGQLSPRLLGARLYFMGVSTKCMHDIRPHTRKDLNMCIHRELTAIS